MRENSRYIRIWIYKVLKTEYNKAETMRMIREEGREEG